MLYYKWSAMTCDDVLGNGIRQGALGKRRASRI